jgi:hypothetical protein
VRNKIFGVIGMVWGGLIVFSRLLAGPAAGSEAYQAGSLAGLVFGVCMFAAGLYAFLKKPAPPKA